jgi:exonuclease VII large subunit
LKEQGVQRAVNRLHESVSNSVEKVQSLAQRMINVGRLFSVSLQKNLFDVENIQKTLRVNYWEKINRFGQKIIMVERIMSSMHPEKTLARGYSITKTVTGKVIRDAKSVIDGESIKTVLHCGIINSIVNSPAKCPQKPTPTLPKPTRNSKKSWRSSKQATLI